MAPPLAQPDLWRRRAELTERKRECAEAWKRFDDFRAEHRAEIAKDRGGAFEKTQRLHETYETLADEVGDLEEKMMAEIDRAAFGKTRGAPGVEFGRLTGVADAFVKNLGAGSVDGLKALVAGASPVPPFFDDRIRQLPQRARFVRSLIPVVAIASDTATYVRQTVRTIAAAPVAAGAVKPTSVVTIEKVDAPVTTIAHLSEPIDRSILADFDDLTELLDAELRYGVLFAQDIQLLNGTGVSPQLRGILQTSGILSQARGTDANHEAIYKAITAVRDQDSPFEPDAIVLHPQNWATIRLAKDANGELLTAPIVESDPDRLWGKEIVTTRAIAQGVGLVGAFGVGAKVYDREEAIVKFAESGALGAGGVEIFSRNLVVARAEERIAFAVERPAAFCQVTGLT